MESLAIVCAFELSVFSWWAQGWAYLTFAVTRLFSCFQLQPKWCRGRIGGILMWNNVNIANRSQDSEHLHYSTSKCQF
ncbi:hypothetical protein H4582DRAFT_2005429 [Lactarius indigo]|nr:hypothetical protein H4582DRAFT_2005429 [Lactarius indigo]